MTLVLIFLFEYVLLPSLRGLAIHLLNLSFKLPDFFNQTGLILFLQLSVLLKRLSRLSEFFLQLFASMLTFTNECLIFCDVLLQIVEDLQLVIQGDESIQFVFKLNLLLLESQLERVFIPLVEHRCCICPSHSFCRGSGGGGLCGTTGPLFCG